MNAVHVFYVFSPFFLAREPAGLEMLAQVCRNFGLVQLDVTHISGPSLFISRRVVSPKPHAGESTTIVMYNGKRSKGELEPFGLTVHYEGELAFPSPDEYRLTGTGSPDFTTPVLGFVADPQYTPDWATDPTITFRRMAPPPEHRPVVGQMLQLHNGPTDHKLHHEVFGGLQQNPWVENGVIAGALPQTPGF